MRGSLRLALKESMKDGGDRSGDDEPRRRRGRPSRADKKREASPDGGGGASPKRKRKRGARKDDSPASVSAPMARGKTTGKETSQPTAGRKRPPEEMHVDAKSAGAPIASNPPTFCNHAGCLSHKEPGCWGYCRTHMKFYQEQSNDASSPADDNEAKIDAFLRGRTAGAEAKRKVNKKLCRGCGRNKAKRQFHSSGWSDPRQLCVSCALVQQRQQQQRKKQKPNPKRVTVVVEKPARDGALGIGLGPQTATAGGVIVNVIKPWSPFADTELEEGMAVETINGEEYESFGECVQLLKKARGHVILDAVAHPERTETGDGNAAKQGENADKEVPDDDYLLPDPIKTTKDGNTIFGRTRACMCPNSSACRAILFRWLRLRQAKYVFFLNMPQGKKTVKESAIADHKNQFREATLRTLGYPTDGSPITRSIYSGLQEATLDKVFSERLSILHFHPEVMSYIINAKETTSVCDRWRVPSELGEKIGLKEEDKCPTPNSKGEATYFALPSYSLERARADVEKAEEQYKQKVREFVSKNESLVSQMKAQPAKYVMKIAELQQQNEQLSKDNRELKEKASKYCVKEREMEKKHERLERGLEKIARRMHTLESAQNTGGITNRDAKDIYKWATGKDLSEKGIYKQQNITDPRLDYAVEAIWNDPTMTQEAALRKGGFDFPPLGQKGVLEKNIMVDGVSLTQRKRDLSVRLRHMKVRMKKKAAQDPEVAREYAERFPEVEPTPEGVYNGLDLRGIPDQPLVHSKGSKSGYRGVQKNPSGTYNVSVGTGENGMSKTLGSFATAEEAAMIYAKAKFYLKEHGYPKEWKSPEKAGAESDHGDSDGEVEKEEGDAYRHEDTNATAYDHHWYS